MKKIKYLILILVVLTCIIYWYKDPVTYSKEWSKRQREKIIEANVIIESNNSDTIQLSKHNAELINVLAGGVLKNNDISSQENREEINILSDKDKIISYEIRRWESGDRSFDGILINKQYHGWCTWYYKNGQIQREGTLINNQPIGTWYYYNDSGKLDSIIDNGKSYLVYFKLNK